MKRLFFYIREYRKECFLGPLFKLFEAAFELIVPLIIADIVDKGIPGGNTPSIIRSSLLLVLLALIGLSASVTAQYFAAKAAIGFSTNLRHALFSHISSLSYSDLDHLGTSSLITRLTGDINQLQSGVNLGLRLLLRSPFVVFGAVIMAFLIDTQSALIFVCVIAALFIIVFGIILGTMPMQRAVRSDLDQVTSSTRENLSGVRVIRAFRREEQETGRFSILNEKLTKAQLRVGRFTAALNPVTYVVLNLAVIILLHVGAIRVDSGTLSQGQVIALYNYMSQILVELIKLANLIVTLTKSAACANRISDILAVPSSQKDGNIVLSSSGIHSISFDNVAVRYHSTGDPALEHISFSAFTGQTIGIIGGTGSGKTTLVNLIPRFYDVSEGSVKINGTDIRNFSLSSLRSAIGFVPQHASLFRGTIRSNLLWGNPDATDSDINTAIHISQAAEIINSKPFGLDEEVQQGGRNFSGGQKQRLTIARALVRKPAILILDDSASALDYATDAALRRSLRELSDPPITFIVSQRTSSVRYADQIIVLDDGLCVGLGTHEELLESCPVYREIHYSQTAGEEGKHVR